jgi:hypothetical protein
MFRTTWQIACPCGGKVGAELGYGTSRVIPDYDGPESFLSPLSFECAACDNVRTIVDTVRHGYHSEIAKIEGGVGSAVYRGEGTPDRFQCPGCGKSQFQVFVTFAYWPEAFDLFDDQPELDAEDFFNAFSSDGHCEVGGEISAVSNFGKL